MHAHAALPSLLYALAPHETHTPDPLTALYVPAGHAEHDPADPVKPAAQSLAQLLAELLPAAELVPEGHCWHVDSSLAPILSEYLPAVHNTHFDSASFPVVAKYLPAPQLSQPELPAVAEYFPASHVRHVLSIVAPGEARIFPATHAVHAPPPVRLL